MKIKINTRLVFSLLVFSFLLLPLNSVGQDFGWPMFLPSIITEQKVCSNDPQTKTWKGLEWQRCDNGNEYNWELANKFCQNLKLAKNTDWRLPTLSELKNLVVCTNNHPVPMNNYHWCNMDGYDGPYDSPTIDSSFQASAKGYWTSTTEGAGTGNAWFINFLGGNAEIHNFQNGNLVRCVRTQ